MKSTKWLDYEKLIGKIYSQIDTESIVKHNDKILGLNSGRMRQIDVSIKRILPGGHDLLVVLSCKHYSRRLTIDRIDEFYGLLCDIRASKGILFCQGGFGKHLINYAKKYNIDLCTLSTVDNRNWQNDITIPFVFISYDYKHKLHFSEALPDEITAQLIDTKDLIVSDNKKTEIKFSSLFYYLIKNNIIKRKYGITHKEILHGCPLNEEKIGMNCGE